MTSYSNQQFEGEQPQQDELPDSLDPHTEPDDAGSPADEEEVTAEDIEEQQKKETFKSLVRRGRHHREPYDFEMFGETVEIELQALTSDIYRQLQQQVQEEVDAETFANILQKRREGILTDDMEIDEVDDDTLSDLMDVQNGQLGALNLAAKYGIDPASVGCESQKEVAQYVDMMVGNKAVDIGIEVMALTADLEQAGEFPGSRGR